MLEKCNYDFDDILSHIKMFTTIDKMDFNDILIGAIDVYKTNIQNKIDKKIEEKEDNIKYLENKTDVCGYDKYDEMELNDLYDDIKKLQDLYASDEEVEDITINDFIWFERDTIYYYLGLDEKEEIQKDDADDKEE